MAQSIFTEGGILLYRPVQRPLRPVIILRVVVQRLIQRLRLIQPLVQHVPGLHGAVLVHVLLLVVEVKLVEFHKK